MWQLLHDVVNIAATFGTLILFWFTFDLVFKENELKFWQCWKFSRCKVVFENKPIRAGMTLISLLLALVSFAFFFIPTGSSPYTIMVSAIVDLGILFASGIIFWVVLHIQYGDWDINRRYPSKGE